MKNKSHNFVSTILALVCVSNLQTSAQSIRISHFEGGPTIKLNGKNPILPKKRLGHAPEKTGLELGYGTVFLTGSPAKLVIQRSRYIENSSKISNANLEIWDLTKIDRDKTSVAGNITQLKCSSDCSLVATSAEKIAILSIATQDKLRNTGTSRYLSSSKLAKRLAPKVTRPPNLNPTTTYELRVVDAKTNNQKWIAKIPSSSSIKNLSFADGGKQILVLEVRSHELWLRSMDTRTGKTLRCSRLPIANGPRDDFESRSIQALGFTDQSTQFDRLPNTKINLNGKHVAVWHRKMPISIFDSRGRLVRRIEGRRHVEEVEFSPDGELVAIAIHQTPNSTVEILDVKTGEVKQIISTLAYSLGFSPNADLIWTSDTLDQNRFVSRSVVGMRAASRGIQSLHNLGIVGTDGPRALTYKVRLWNCKTGTELFQIDSGLKRPGTVGFVSKTLFLTTGIQPTTLGSRKSAFLWNLEPAIGN